MSRPDLRLSLMEGDVHILSLNGIELDRSGPRDAHGLELETLAVRLSAALRVTVQRYDRRPRPISSRARYQGDNIVVIPGTGGEFND